MLLTILVLFAVVAAPVIYAARGNAAAPSGDARRLLEERLAAGEVSTEEYRSRVAVLAERGHTRRQWTPMIVGLLALALIAALGSVAGWGMGWRGWTGYDEVMVDHMGASARSASAVQPAVGADEAVVTATDLEFQPSTLTAVAGEPVNVTLVNEGEVFHDLTIPDLGFVLNAEPGERIAGGLTAAEPGRYEFFCSVPGHAAAGMRGTLAVSGSASGSR